MTKHGRSTHGCHKERQSPGESSAINWECVRRVACWILLFVFWLGLEAFRQLVLGRKLAYRRPARLRDSGASYWDDD
jgi:hypothetical protein